VSISTSSVLLLLYIKFSLIKETDYFSLSFTQSDGGNFIAILQQFYRINGGATVIVFIRLSTALPADLPISFQNHVGTGTSPTLTILGLSDEVTDMEQTPQRIILDQARQRQ
jgi:hypothetical protein